MKQFKVPNFILNLNFVKKFTLVFSLIFISTMMSLWLSSCSKSSISQDSAIVDQNDLILSKVTDYSNLHRAFLSGESLTGFSFSDMTKEDGLWTIEATANFDYAAVYGSIDETYQDGIDLSADNSSNGMVSAQSLLSCYDKLYNFIAEKVMDNRVLIVCDVEISSSDEESTKFHADIQTATLASVTGKSSQTDGFISSDYWYPFFNEGKCDIYYPAYAGSKDGGDRIAQVLKASWGFPTCSEGTATFGTDITSIDIADILPTGGGGYTYYDYYEDDCQSPTDLQTEFTLIAPRVAAYRPSGKVEKSVTVFEDFIVGEDDIYGHHVYTIKYANIICVPLD